MAILGKNINFQHHFYVKMVYFDKKIEVSLIINNACHNCLIIFDKNKRFWRDKNFPIFEFYNFLNFSFKIFNSDAFILACCQLNNLTDYTKQRAINYHSITRKKDLLRIFIWNVAHFRNNLLTLSRSIVYQNSFIVFKFV